MSQYPDLESLIEKVEGCKDNSENLSTTEIGQNIPCA